MMPNETIQTICSRKSIRKYLPDPVPKEMIETILECARFAPSGLNNQPWRYIVIEQKNTKISLSKLTHYSEIMLSAPVLIAGFLDTAASYHREKDIAAMGASLENILLAAHSLGLGAVWLGEILKNKDQVAKILNAPDNFELIAVIAIGFFESGPMVSGERTDRKNLDEIIFWEKYPKN
ncbi:nitroreductase [Methanolapillus ohkumae]|uniref:Bifunctional F420 biosynthesis protein FbiB n=1 Tax=Methanolapillus ohkumae TaxID=3028298 RepID=A0AA96ZX75_9EURY|nr:Bifunctional F420 biosynthesis protein FbiB [Methanosarcinaceae archaeon Am2]